MTSLLTTIEREAVREGRPVLYAVLATALARMFSGPGTLGGVMERAVFLNDRERVILARGIAQVRMIAEIAGKMQAQALDHGIEAPQPAIELAEGLKRKRVAKVAGIGADEGAAAVLLKGLKHPGLANVYDAARWRKEDWIVREAATIDLSEDVKWQATTIVERANGLDPMYETPEKYLRMKNPGTAFVRQRIKRMREAPPGSPRRRLLPMYEKHGEALADVANGVAAARRAGVILEDFGPDQFGRIGKRIVTYDYGHATLTKKVRRPGERRPAKPSKAPTLRQLGDGREELQKWLKKNRLTGESVVLGKGMGGKVLGFKEAKRMFKLKPHKALSYFGILSPSRRKAVPPGWLNDHRRKAFTMAEVTERTVLKRVHDLVFDAIEEGKITVRDFKVSLEDLGVTSKNPQYAEMVFRTNALDSYNTGYYEEVRDDPDLGDYFPYWEYLAVEDDRLSDEHAERLRGGEGGGPYYPASRSFDEVRGPRVFNCRCSFRWVDKFEAKTLGLIA